ncbi:MAG: T9SS type A sorting domain-containing protein [Cytophagaceae bacterium]
MEVLKNYTSTGNSCNTAGMLPDNSSTVHLKSNPVQDVLNLELSSFFTDIVIEIIDSRGGFVNRYIKSGQTINIDVKSLPAGIYILSISTNDRSERLRMVKN